MPRKTDFEIGMRLVACIEKIAEESGVKRADVMKKMGVNPKNINYWKYGEQTPSAYALKMAACIGLDVHYILTGQRRG